MFVTEIQQQKNNEDRFSIFVDGKYSFSLSGNDLLEHKVKIKMELDEVQVKKFEKISADSLLLSKAYDKCLRRPHSVREIRDYLTKNKASDELSDAIIEKCLDRNLLNDEYFAERWYEHRKNSNRSDRFIQNELFKKGVAKEIIDKTVKGDDKQALKDAINKKINKYDDERKLIAYLQRQGFNYYDIVTALKED